jgi:hypothetical protein
MCVFGVGAVVAPAAPVPTHLMPKEPPAYFPTTVGTEWVYTEKGYETKLTITKVRPVEKGVLIFVEQVVEPGRTFPNYTMLVSRSGLAMTEVAGQAYAPHWELLRLPYRPLDRWETAVKCASAPGQPEITLKREMTTRGEEDVLVPGGKFLSVRVDSERILNGGAKERWSVWFSMGVGIVKEEWAQGGRELKSFRAGAQTPK